MDDVGPCFDGLALLTPRAEERLRRAVERVRGYVVDADQAAQSTAAVNVEGDCEAVPAAVVARDRSV